MEGPKRRGSIRGRGRPAHANVFRVPNNISVTLGLQWNFIGEEPIDLDASCVAFDRDCNAIDVVFFNHVETDGGYMVHSGDNRTGEDDGDDDEAITFHMAKIPDYVQYLMVCVTSYTGADFREVESANVRVINNADGRIVGTFALSVVGQHTASLLCVFSRHSADPTEDPFAAAAAAGGAGMRPGTQPPQQFWDLREINKPCTGFSFCDVLPEMLKLLNVTDSAEVTERARNLPNYLLTKNNDMDTVPLSQMRFGLGWDGDNDLDACMVMLGQDGAYMDHVHAKYGKLRSRDGAASHSGDKLNGYAVQGDDEFIDLNLMAVDPRTTVIYFLAILYDGLADSLREVPKAYVRMQNKASPSDRNMMEIARYEISRFQETFTTLVAFAAVRQSASHWALPLAKVGLGLGGRDWVDGFPFLRTYHRINPQVGRPALEWNDAWANWTVDLFPFAVRVTFGAVRNLSPQEPQFFRCHCLAWVQDRKEERFRSLPISDRDNVHFDESCRFVVNKLDIIRVMVYETAMVGWADIPMAPFFGESGAFPAPLVQSPNSSSPAGPTGGGASATETQGTPQQASYGGGPPGNGNNASIPVPVVRVDQPATPREERGDGGAGDEEMREIVEPAAAAAASGGPDSSSSSSSAADSHNGSGKRAGGDDAGSKRPEAISLADGPRKLELPPEGHLLVDAWFPLAGQDVGGEIHLRLERVPMPEAPKQRGSSGCLIM